MHKIIAIPSINEQGLNSKISLHFGHCETYTIVSIEDNKIKKVKTIVNSPFAEKRTCMTPVQYLLDNGVQILITNSVGQRPFVYLNQAGIEVLYSEEKFVHEILKDFLKGTVKKLETQDLCGAKR